MDVHVDRSVSVAVGGWSRAGLSERVGGRLLVLVSALSRVVLCEICPPRLFSVCAVAQGWFLNLWAGTLRLQGRPHYYGVVVWVRV